MADKTGDSIQGTPTPSPPPCAKGCGFFGSPSTLNMCSKCYRDHQQAAASSSDQTKKDSPPQSASVDLRSTPAPLALSTPPSASEQQAMDVTLTAATATAETASTSSAVSLPSTTDAVITTPPQSASADIAAELAAAVQDPAAPPPRKVQKNTSRCFTCRKKIGLMGFECRCGYFYCSEHRYSDKHDCDFDYQASAREQLEKQNPVVVASKLEKI